VKQFDTLYLNPVTNVPTTKEIPIPQWKNNVPTTKDATFNLFTTNKVFTANKKQGNVHSHRSIPLHNNLLTIINQS